MAPPSEQQIRQAVREELAERATGDRERARKIAKAGAGATLAMLLAGQASAAPSGHFGGPGQPLESVYTEALKDTADASLVDLPSGGPVTADVILSLPTFASDPAGTSAGEMWYRSDTEEVRVDTESNGVVAFPTVAPGSLPTDGLDIVRIETASGTRVLPVAATADAVGDYVRIQTQNQGVVGLHKSTGLATLDNYIEDDFDDNNLTGRTSQSRGAFLEPASDHAGRVLAGIYRPDYTTDSGTPSATGGALELSAGNTTDQRLTTQSEFTTGFWEWDATASSDPTSGTMEWTIMGLDVAHKPTDGYILEQQNTGTLRFIKVVGGSTTELIGTTWPDDTNLHTFKITRDPFGGFEVFQDTVSEGTVTDTSHTTSLYYTMSNRMNTTMTVDNLVIS